MPVSSTPGTVSQTLAVEIDPTKAALTSADDVIAPAGWTVEYSTDGTTFSSTAPTSSGGWAAVRAVRATGAVTSVGSAGGYQVSQGSATGSAVSTAPAFIASSGTGDGYEAFFDPGRTRVFNIYHHENTYGASPPATLDCHVLVDGSTCAGFPLRMEIGTNHVSLGRIIGTKLWVTGIKDIPNDSPDLGWQVVFRCIELADVIRAGGLPRDCATKWVPVGSFDWDTFKRGNADDYNGTIDLAGASHVGTSGSPKLWTMNAQNGRLLCLDTATSAACSGMPANGWSVPWPGGLKSSPSTYFVRSYLDASIALWDGRIYLKAWATTPDDWRLTCVLESDPSTACPGFTGSTSGFGTGQFRDTGEGKLIDLPSSSGGTAAVCVVGRPLMCVDADGASVTPPASFTLLSYYGYGPHPVRMGTRVYLSDESNFYCWDASLAGGAGAGCFGGQGSLAANTLSIPAANSYTFVPDPLVPDCGWGGFHTQPTLRTYNLKTGQTGTAQSPACSGLAPKRISFSGAPAIPRMGCNVGANDTAIRSWRLFQLTAPATGFTAARLTVQDSFGAPIPGWTDLPLSPTDAPPFSRDLSTLPVSMTGQSPQFSVDIEGGGSVSSGSAVIQAVGDAPQLCLQPIAILSCNQTSSLGPVDTAVLAGSTLTPTGSGSANAGSLVTYTPDSKSVSISAPSASQCGSALSGKATDGAGGGGTGVPGITVTLLDSSGLAVLDANGQPVTATTAADGSYSFGALKPGSYKVSFPSAPSAVSVSAQAASGDTGTDTTSVSAAGGTSVSGTTVLDIGSPGVVNGRYSIPAGATADTSTGGQGVAQSVNPLANDTASTGSTLTASSVKLCDPASTPPEQPRPSGAGCTKTSLTVANQGTYSVNGTSGALTFTPLAGFTGVATPVTYEVRDAASSYASSIYTPTVVPVPVATDDISSGAWDVNQAITPLSNDSAGTGTSLNTGSLKLCGTSPVQTPPNCTQTSLSVANQGTYTVSGSTVIFDPVRTFTGTATPVRYQVSDSLATPQVANAYITPSVTAPPAPTAADEGKQVAAGASVSFTTITGAGGLASTAGPVFTTSQTFLCGVSPVETPPSCTKTSVAVAGEGTYTLNQSTGVVTYAADASATSGPKTPASYVVKDELGRTASATLTPGIPGPPAVAPDASTGSWDTDQLFRPLLNDASVDSTLVAGSVRLCASGESSPCTRSTLFVAGEGTYTVNPDGTVAFDPLPTFAVGGQATATPVTYSVLDAVSRDGSSTLTATVNPPGPLTAGNDTEFVAAGRTAEFAPLTGAGGLAASGGPAITDACLIEPGSSPAACDSDGVVEIPGEGTFVLDPSTQVVSYTPCAAAGSPVASCTGPFTGTPTAMSYQVTDSVGRTATGTLTPVIPPAPSAVADTSEGGINTAQTISPLGNDAPGVAGVPLDSSTLRLCAVGATPCTSTSVTTANGTYAVSNGVVTFTPNPGFLGTDAGVAYTVQDELGRAVSSTITPTVVADPYPALQPDAQSGTYGSAITFDALAGNGSGSAADSPGSAPGPQTSGSLTTSYTSPTLNATTLKLCGAGELPPDCTQTSVTTADGTYSVSGSTVVFTGGASFTGTATQPVTYQVSNAFDKVVIDAASTTVTTTVTDPASTCLAGDGCSFTVANDAQNDPPTIANPDCALTPQGPTCATDPTVTNPAYTPTWEVTQAQRTVTSMSKTASSTITPTIVAPPASGVADTASTAWNTAVTEDVLADDSFAGQQSAIEGTLTLCGPSDGGNCAQTSVQVTGEGTYDVVSGRVRFTPDAGFTGTATPITYAVTDALGRVVSATFTPTVAPPTGPTATADAKNVVAGQSVGFVTLLPGQGAVTAGDNPVQSSSTCLIDPATSQCAASTTVVTADGTFVLDRATGIVTFTASANAPAGPLTPIGYQVTDSFGLTARSTLTPTVLARPSAPSLASSDLAGVAQAFDVLASATADASTTVAPSTVKLCASGETVPNCTAPSVTVAGKGTFTVAPGTGVITFTPDAGFTGTVPAQPYALTDALGQRASGTLTPTVAPLPTPVATDDTQSGSVGSPLTFTPSANDAALTGSRPTSVDPTLALAPTSLRLCAVGETPRPAGAGCTAMTLTAVDGTYEVDPTTGSVTFTPAPGFSGTATNPAVYEIANTFTVNGGAPQANYASARLIPTITPAPSAPPSPPGPPAPTTPDEPETNTPLQVPAADDPAVSVNETRPCASARCAPGVVQAEVLLRPQAAVTVVDPDAPVVLDPLQGSRPSEGERFRPASVRVWDGSGWVREFTEPGVGTWTVVDGQVEFMPAAGFTGSARIKVKATDTAGVGATALLRVKVTPRGSDQPDPSPADRPVTSASTLDVLPKTGTPVNLAILAGIALVAGGSGTWLLRKSR